MSGTATPKNSAGRADPNAGQALVEFILTLVLAITIVSLLGIGLRNSLMVFWQTATREVGAPCPDCKVPDGQEWRMRR